MLLTQIITLLGFLGGGFVEGASSIDDLARDIARVESVRQIKNIQRQLSHLVQFGLWHQVGNLFSSNSTFTWGGTTVYGSPSIESWLRTDAGNMDGIQRGSLDSLIAENPVITLGTDGRTAKGRWNGIRFQGDGKGRTRIQGGIYENEYARTENGWRISLLHYYAMYEGTYEDGWRNVDGKGLAIVPYHFTPEGSGVPIPPTEGEPQLYNGTKQHLEARIQRLNEEDDIRNLMHAHGYYVDRRMWSDVVDLHAENTTVKTNNGTIFTGKSGVRTILERMGPEGMTQGINNDHPIFDMIVEVHANGEEAYARGLEIAMLGNANTRAASWEFSVFRNRLVKEAGIWKVQGVEITPLIAADYYNGWGNGGTNQPNSYIPPFLDIGGSVLPSNNQAHATTDTTIDDMKRRLQRSAAYDGAENQSHAYGYFLDDLQASEMGGLFAQRGHKASPFAGFFQTPERIAQANKASYGTNRSALRSSISFHWRPQPVVLVSEDGRSATLRARLLQPSTSINKTGSFNSAIYHDQVVLEDGKWRLWSVTIDEFYWQSTSWKEGWSMANPRNSNHTNAEPPAWTKKYPPDLTLADVGERESTFTGGSGRAIQWPEIQRMWFQYRNLVSGRMPEWYWPGCVPCQVRKDWSLEANGWQEPETGPRAPI
ncbi:Nn.00g062850.m01.CDS01 [Neocucurbitaria sp. VM-36]